MSIENDLKRLADAAEGILAWLQGTEVTPKKAGRPRKTETVDPVAQTPAVPETPVNPALADAKPAAQMETVAGPTTASVTTIPTPLAQAAADKPLPTVVELQTLIGQKIGQGKREAVLKLVTESGGQSGSTVPEAKRRSVFDAIQAL